MFFRISPLVVLALLWLLLIYELSVQWRLYEQYHYAWAVPLLCLDILRRRWISSSSLAKGTAQSSGGENLQPSTCNFRPPALDPSHRATILVLGLAALLYAPTRWLHEANPIWRLTSWLWTGELITMTLCVLCLLKGAAAVRRLWLPIAFFALAVPWPSGLEHLVVEGLTRFNTSAVVEVLGVFGVPALEHGNLIETSTGPIGIEEACSGIRSLQATLMLSAFLGDMYLLTFWRRIFCILTGGIFSGLGNLVRATVLAGVAAQKGPSAIDEWHDWAGVSILVMSFVGLWFLAHCLSCVGINGEPQARAGVAQALEPAESPTFQSAGGRTRGWLRRLENLRYSRLESLRYALVLAVWFGAVEVGTRLWYRAHERGSGGSIGWTLKAGPQISGFEWVKIRPEILEQFRAEEAVEARWNSSRTGRGQLYYFRWRPAGSLRRRAELQLARTHGPERCLPAFGLRLESDLGLEAFAVRGFKLALGHYVFTAAGRRLQVFYGVYEDNLGSEEPVPARSAAGGRFGAALAGSRSYGQRFLEIALFDIQETDCARAVLADLLPRLLGPETSGSPRQ